MAQGDMEAGERSYRAYRDGAGFAAWRRAFADYVPPRLRPTVEVTPPLTQLRHRPVALPAV
jgi:hypothetical protein